MEVTLLRKFSSDSYIRYCVWLDTGEALYDRDPDYDETVLPPVVLHLPLGKHTLRVIGTDVKFGEHVLEGDVEILLLKDWAYLSPYYTAAESKKVQ